MWMSVARWVWWGDVRLSSLNGANSEANNSLSVIDWAPPQTTVTLDSFDWLHHISQPKRKNDQTNGVDGQCKTIITMTVGCDNHAPNKIDQPLSHRSACTRTVHTHIHIRLMSIHPSTILWRPVKWTKYIRLPNAKFHPFRELCHTHTLYATHLVYFYGLFVWVVCSAFSPNGILHGFVCMCACWRIANDPHDAWRCRIRHTFCRGASLSIWKHSLSQSALDSSLRTFSSPPRHAEPWNRWTNKWWKSLASSSTIADARKYVALLMALITYFIRSHWLRYHSGTAHRCEVATSI